MSQSSETSRYRSMRALITACTAPMTRCRGTVSESDSRQYLANDLMIKYYVERAGTPGTLMISEALPTSLRGSAMPGCPGITSDEQVEAWSKVVKAVHEKDCPFVGQRKSLLAADSRLADNGRQSGIRVASTSRCTLACSPGPRQRSRFRGRRLLARSTTSRTP